MSGVETIQKYTRFLCCQLRLNRNNVFSQQLHGTGQLHSTFFPSSRKAVNFLNVTLNLTICKDQPYNKADNNSLYINILSNHPPNLIKNLRSNISKRIDNLSADETTFKNL